MKKSAMLVLLAVIVGVASVSFAKAKEADKKQQPTVVGKVVVVADADGVITSVQLQRRAVIYNVVLNEKGIELGEKMDGKIVAVKAVESEKNEEKWLTVESYREVQRRGDREGDQPRGRDGDRRRDRDRDKDSDDK